MDKWEPNVRRSRNLIIVEAKKGEDEYFTSSLFMTGRFEVSPPDFFERLLGMTLESKFKSAEKSCKMTCDILNANDEKAMRQAKEIDDILKSRCVDGNKRLL